MAPRATGPRSEYTITLSDGASTIGIQTQSKTGIRRLPRGPGVERKAIKQANWTGGRGNERFATDTTRYFESTNLWSTVQGQACNGPLRVISDTPALQAHATAFPTGAVSTTYTVTATPLTRSLVTPSGGFSATMLSFIARRVGTPNDLTIKLCTDISGAPGIVLQTLTLTAAMAADVELNYRGVTLTTQALASATTYWVTFTTTVTAAGSWMLLGTGGSPYARLSASPSDIKRVKFFEYKRGLYALVIYRDGATAAKILRNGDRGCPTNIPSGATQSTTTIVDNTKSWIVNEWAGCVVFISRGINRHEYRTIVSNTAKALTLDAALPRACSVGSGCSEYVILGSKKWSTVVATSGGAAIALNAAASDVCVFNEIVYVAQTSGAVGSAIWHYREWNDAGVWKTDAGAADGTNKADYLITAPHWSSGVPAIWSASNEGTCSQVAPAVTYGSNLVFEAAMPVGDPESSINSIIDYNGSIYVGKDDSVWQEKEGSFKKVPLGIDKARDERNGVSMIWWNTQIFTSLLGGLERLYGTTLDDIGPDRDQGMIAARRGNIVDMVNVANQLYCLYQSPNGNSSLLVTTDPGGDWHNLTTINGTATVASGIFYQTIPGQANRLWIGTRYDLWYCVMPDELHNPIRDSNMRYAWESFLTTSWIDADTPELDHFFDELRFATKNLGAANPRNSIEIEYQLDDEIYEGTWIAFPSTITASPYQRISVGDSNVTGRRIRFRFRLTCDCVTPVILNSYELRLNTMNEVLYDYLFDMKIADRMMLMNGNDTVEDWSTMMAVLESWKEDATPLTLRTPMPGTDGVIDNIRGHIDPVSLVTNEWDDQMTNLSGQIVFKQT